MAAVAPLITIVGPTASGKSDLAIRLAEEYGGEIICADSRTVYKDLSIGTAKPSAEDRRRVPHWGLDLATVDRPYSAADFQSYANKKIEEIRARGNVPFLVGGTGLYVDAVILQYEFGPPPDPRRRKELAAMSLEELQEYCHKHNIKLPNNFNNKRYVMRSIEQNGAEVKRRESPVDNAIVVGIATDRGTLRQRISQRIKKMFADGVVDEGRAAAATYGWDVPALTGNIYRLVQRYDSGELTLEEAMRAAETADWQLVKRQITWWRRREYVRWADIQDSEQFLRHTLATLNKP